MSTKENQNPRLCQFLINWHQVFSIDVTINVSGIFYVKVLCYYAEIMIARPKCVTGYAEDGGVTVKLIWLSPKFFIISPDLRYFETLKCIERNDKKLGECYDINKCRR